jgi:hypothetical protein
MDALGEEKKNTCHRQNKAPKNTNESLLSAGYFYFSSFVHEKSEITYINIPFRHSGKSPDHIPH